MKLDPDFARELLTSLLEAVGDGISTVDGLASLKSSTLGPERSPATRRERSSAGKKKD